MPVIYNMTSVKYFVSPSDWESTVHELINFKDATTKCRLYWCLIEFIDWRYSQSCWYFRPSFVNYCPLTFSLVQPTPLPKVNIHYVQTVCG
jgi:hypothetical protein